MESPNVTRVGNWAAVAVILFFLAAILLPISYFFVLPRYQTAQLLKNGIQAEGVITAIAPTGTYYNSQPEAEITIQVHSTTTPEMILFTTKARQVINPLSASPFQPGKKVLIRYEQSNPSKATIEYAEGS